MLKEHYLKKELYDLIKTDERIFEFIQEGSLDGLWYWDLEKPENEWMNNRFWTTLWVTTPGKCLINQMHGRILSIRMT